MMLKFTLSSVGSRRMGVLLRKPISFDQYKWQWQRNAMGLRGLTLWVYKEDAKQTCFRSGAKSIFLLHIHFWLHSMRRASLSGVGVTAICSEFTLPAGLCSCLPVNVFLPARFNIAEFFLLSQKSLHAARLFKDGSPVHFWSQSTHLRFWWAHSLLCVLGLDHARAAFVDDSRSSFPRRGTLRPLRLNVLLRCYCVLRVLLLGVILITQVGLFGGAVECFAQRFSYGHEQTEA